MTPLRINTVSSTNQAISKRLPLARKGSRLLVKEMADSRNNRRSSSKDLGHSPIMLIKKKDGSTRFCVDYRRLNEILIKDSYPSTRIDDTLDALRLSNGSRH
ncbi:hypothetical protein AVEN_20366-1 [Araneus ventricosus]|uniref:Transposon Ty3-I Gag-Pol polyprotein n=1 Tax=Araneus ventricosus TaxID=182803 RepID=A0A4Y2FTH9_ARAVE|nr:hypothetical protein AVEN_20366-1 [Araneus ventricosus]